MRDIGPTLTCNAAKSERAEFSNIGKWLWAPLDAHGFFDIFESGREMRVEAKEEGTRGTCTIRSDLSTARL